MKHACNKVQFAQVEICEPRYHEAILTRASIPRREEVRNPGAARKSRAADPGDSPRPGQAQFGEIPGCPRNLARYPGLHGQSPRGTDWDVKPGVHVEEESYSL